MTMLRRLWTSLREWVWPSPPPSVRCDFDTLALARGGGLFRYRLRRDARPVHTLERASLVLFGMIAGVALVGVMVMAMGGKP